MTRLADAARQATEARQAIARGETVAAKARRLLGDGCLTVLAVAPGRVDAVCRGDTGTWHLRYRPGAWSCSCPSFRRCAHLEALQLVVDRPTRTSTAAARFQAAERTAS